jgi:ABC-2 type transport system ATP-binding protein
LPISPILSAKGLTRAYHNTNVLENVNFDLFPGEVCGIIGPNGGGKSTLLMLLAGLVRPTSGTVKMEGIDTHELAMEKSGAIGLITALAGLYPALTGRENLQYFGGLFGLSNEEVSDRAEPFLAELGLTSRADLPVSGYSSGMQQKLSLVRARLLNPRVLLLDEPTAALDPVSADTIYQTMRDLADSGISVAVVTHDLHAAEAICDRVAVIKQSVVELTTLDGERNPPPHGALYNLYEKWAR